MQKWYTVLVQHKPLESIFAFKKGNNNITLWSGDLFSDNKNITSNEDIEIMQDELEAVSGGNDGGNNKQSSIDKQKEAEKNNGDSSYTKRLG